MGLDVFVFEYLDIPDTIQTEKELDAFCEEHGGGWTMYSESHKNLPKKYIKKIPLELIDWEATFQKRGLNYDDYQESCACDGCWYEFGKISSTNTFQEDIARQLSHLAGIKEPDPVYADAIRFKNDEVLSKIELVDVWAYGREVGYQRKGANNQFYDDGKWDDNTIVSTKKMLLEDWRKYFSDKNDSYYGKDAKQHFKENIIDRFIPGKTFVAYW